MGEGPESSTLRKLISVPGLVGVGVLGAAVTALARVFGPENLLREVLAEVIASFGSTILVLATFGLLFRSGLQRLLRDVPGGEALVQAAERNKEVLQDANGENLGGQAPEGGDRLDRIGEDVRTLLDEDVPALREEVAQLRKSLAESKLQRHD